jgi:hypothetical protein
VYPAPASLKSVKKLGVLVAVKRGSHRMSPFSTGETEAQSTPRDLPKATQPSQDGMEERSSLARSPGRGQEGKV